MKCGRWYLLRRSLWPVIASDCDHKCGSRSRSVGVAGLGEEREVSAAAAAVVTAPSPSLPLALTGQTISGLVTVGTLLLLGGAALVLFERREEQTEI